MFHLVRRIKVFLLRLAITVVLIGGSGQGAPEDIDLGDSIQAAIDVAGPEDGVSDSILDQNDVDLAFSNSANLRDPTDPATIDGDGNSDGSVSGGVGVDGDDYKLSITSTVPLPRIRVNKTANVSSGTPSNCVQFVIKVTNVGGTALDSIVVRDQLPEGLEYVDDNHNRTKRTVQGSNINWTLGSLDVGQSRSIELTARIDGSRLGSITNQVNVTAISPAGAVATAEDSVEVKVRRSMVPRSSLSSKYAEISRSFIIQPPKPVPSEETRNIIVVIPTIVGNEIVIPALYIQDAIDAASPGDIILVHGGYTYTGSINISKSLSLTPLRGMPVIDAEGGGSAITLSADGISLEGFMIMNSAEAGIEIVSDNNIIRKNKVERCGDGILIRGASKNVIQDNTISYNSYGIRLFSSNDNIIKANSVHNNGNYGIYIDSSDDNHIYLNKFNNPNSAYSNSNNLWNSPTLENYKFKGQSFTNYRGNLWSDYDGNDLNENGIGDTPYHVSGVEYDNYPLKDRESKTFNVCASGCDYISIQDAIDAAIDGDAILVYSGTYSENVDVNKSLTLRGVDTDGGLPVVDAITLSADGCTLEGFVATNPDYNGIRVNSDGNKITGNTANGNNCCGIVLSLFSNNNMVTGNTANGNNGDGIYISGYDNAITGNTASGNNEDGIFLWSSSDSTISDNTASNNEGSGISLNESSNNAIKDNTATGNNYDGIYLDSSNDNTISDNTANNSEGCGIVLWSSNDNAITYNTANGNSYDGIFLWSSNDNTISDNTANNGEGCGIYLDSSSDNAITGNTSNDNGGDIDLWSSSDDIIIIPNAGGISLIESSSTTVPN